jgi:putative transposase
MDRFHCQVINSNEYFNSVQVYIETNIFRTQKRLHPKLYKWSSYHHYAAGKNDPLITESQTYIDMGSTPDERQKCYASLVDDLLREDIARRLGYTSKKKWKLVLFLGDPDWVARQHKRLNVWRLRRRQRLRC